MNFVEVKQRRIRLAPFLAALACFALPFFDVSCANQKVMSVTGIEVALGGEKELQVPKGWENPNQKKETQKIDRQPGVTIALVCAFAGVAFCFVPGRPIKLLPAAAGVAGAVMLLLIKSLTQAEVAKESKGMITVEAAAGFYIVVGSLVAGAIISVLQFSGKVIRIGADTPPGESSGGDPGTEAEPRSGTRTGWTPPGPPPPGGGDYGSSETRAREGGGSGGWRPPSPPGNESEPAEAQGSSAEARAWNPPPPPPGNDVGGTEERDPPGDTPGWKMPAPPETMAKRSEKQAPTISSGSPPSPPPERQLAAKTPASENTNAERPGISPVASNTAPSRRWMILAAASLVVVLALAGGIYCGVRLTNRYPKEAEIDQYLTSRLGVAGQRVTGVSAKRAASPVAAAQRTGLDLTGQGSGKGPGGETPPGADGGTLAYLLDPKAVSRSRYEFSATLETTEALLEEVPVERYLRDRGADPAIFQKVDGYLRGPNAQNLMSSAGLTGPLVDFGRRRLVKETAPAGRTYTVRGGLLASKTNGKWDFGIESGSLKKANAPVGVRISDLKGEVLNLDRAEGAKEADTIIKGATAALQRLEKAAEELRDIDERDRAKANRDAADRQIVLQMPREVQDTLKLVNARVDESLILNYIKRVTLSRQMTANEIIYLQNHGVSMNIIGALARSMSVAPRQVLPRGR